MCALTVGSLRVRGNALLEHTENIVYNLYVSRMKFVLNSIEAEGITQALDCTV